MMNRWTRRDWVCNNLQYLPAYGLVYGLVWILTCAVANMARAEVTPTSITLPHARARQQVLLTLGGRDMTQTATFRVENPAVAQVDSSGKVRGQGKGSTELLVTHGQQTWRVPVQVKAFDPDAEVDFANEIVPTLTKLGCNAGVCHGKASGRGGFKLSLLGYDPKSDYDALTREARGRRVFPASPDQSLLLRKATARVAHAGGKKLDPHSEAYALLRRWITQGMPVPREDRPRLRRLTVYPPELQVTAGQTQQLVVVAEFSNGVQQDVTEQSQFFSDLEVVAKVNPHGLVTAGARPGEATIMARHQGLVTVFRAMAPYGPPRDLSAFPIRNYIDQLAVAKWQKLGLAPSPICDDATFIRRVTIDLAGRLPTVEETRGFLADHGTDKRTRLVDRLLASPDYPAFFAMRWGTILRNSNLAGANQASYAFHNWIKDKIARNRPYDEFVRGVVAAAGEWPDAPAINWYWQMRDDQLHQVVADTSQVFLGTRLQCARCHQHPYEKWGQDDYFGLVGFFQRVGRKSFGEPPPYFSAANITLGESHPLTGRAPEPKFLAGAVAKFTPEQDPRHGLVDWMAQPDNPFFARALVNRLWGHFFGRGLVDPVDDLRETNPPSNPALLDALAKDFIARGFDMRHVIRTIVTSSLYQLDSAPTENNREDRSNFTRFYARRMIAEVLLDSVDQAAGTRSSFGGLAASARAIDLPHENFGSYFLDLFDRPRRVSGCECERSSAATLGQVLLMANSDDVENKIADGNGRVAKLARAKVTPEAAVEELYLAALSRLPTDAERAKAITFLKGQKDFQPALEDVLWSLLNGREFLFNH